MVTSERRLAGWEVSGFNESIMICPCCFDDSFRRIVALVLVMGSSSKMLEREKWLLIRLKKR
jgi:hypothetical protein